jgi:hypothetical protein
MAFLTRRERLVIDQLMARIWKELTRTAVGWFLVLSIDERESKWIRSDINHHWMTLRLSGETEVASETQTSAPGETLRQTYESFRGQQPSSLEQWMTLTVGSQSREIFTWQSIDDRSSFAQEVYFIPLTRRLACHLVLCARIIQT